MATISSANFLAIADSLGVIYRDSFLGLANATEVGDLSDGVDANVTRILALTDIQQTAALASGFSSLKTLVADPIKTAAEIFKPALDALQKHVVNINTYLNTAGVKVSSDFAALWRAVYGSGSLQAVYVFSQEVVIARSATVTGATTVTQTAGTDLDAAAVGPVQFEVEVTTVPGSTTSVTLTMKKANATTETKVVSLTTADTSGTKVNVGTGSDLYIGCTNIAITGGTTGAFKVQNKVTRVATV